MKLSKSYFLTLREDSSNDLSKSGSLLVKSGMIKKIGSGIYTYLPLGLKVLKNIENIIREEMNKAGAEELLMPSMLPIDIYETCNRVESFGENMFKFKDRTGRKYALGPTHEELFTITAKDKVKSYKDLPFNLYQFSDKFRDEIRSRYGLIRVREFIMKDAYSFDTEETYDESYKKMYNAYKNSFDKMKLKYEIVKANTGAMGGDLSEEFQAITDIGEDILVFCNKCNYSSNLEVAEKKLIEENEKEKILEKVYTPNTSTIEEVCQLLKTDIKKSVKAMLMNVNGELVIFFLRGDRELNLEKACSLLNVNEITFAKDELIDKSNAVAGYTGLINSTAKIVIDNEILLMKNFITGANEKDYHYINTNVKDIKYDLVGDISNVVENDICNCGGNLYFKKGIEIGNLFKLGKKYSKAFNLTYLDKDNKENEVLMGCYGIGLGRVLAAIIEQNNDEKGMILPLGVSAYDVAIVITNIKDENLLNYANILEKELEQENIKVLVDDRDERAGVKFNDVDLIGIPIRIVVGKSLLNNEVEIKLRKEENSTNIKITEVIETIKEIIKNNK